MLDGKISTKANVRRRVLPWTNRWQTIFLLFRVAARRLDPWLEKEDLFSKREDDWKARISPQGRPDVAFRSIK